MIPSPSTPKVTSVRIGLALLAAGIGIAAFFAVRQQIPGARRPDSVALAYARAVYARDFGKTWEFVSDTDRQCKTRDQYLAENSSFTGLEQDLAYILAGWIEFTETSIQSFGGDRATVTTHVKAPNGNQPEAYEILHARPRAGPPQHNVQPGRLAVVMDWAGVIVVKLTAEVSPGLPWDFYSLQTEVRALPGETLTAIYRVVNRSGRTITARPGTSSYRKKTRNTSPASSGFASSSRHSTRAIRWT